MNPKSNGKKPIAVLGPNLERTRDWLLNHFNIVYFNIQQLKFMDNDGQEYRIILQEKQAKGMEFSAVLLSTSTGINFELIDIVKLRIRD